MSAKEMIKTTDMALQGKALEDFVVRGNLAALSPTDKAAHYIQLCQSLGLNPATKPFEYLNLQGKEVLYARRDCTDQLRALRSVSIEIVARETTGDVFQVTARASLPDGRRDESIGAVSIAGLKGDVMANALMKCETKAKRRVTLSICGLGMLDESELETVDRFANLRQEQEPARVIEMKQEPKRAESKKSEAIPEAPAVVTKIPPSILLALKPLHGLEGIALQDMSDDDLELVREHASKARAVWAVTAKSKRALDWLDGMAKTAAAVLDERNGNNPPPPVEE